MLLYSVEPKKVNVEIEAPEFIVINEDFSLNVTLIDSDTGNVMDDSMLIVSCFMKKRTVVSVVHIETFSVLNKQDD